MKNLKNSLLVSALSLGIVVGGVGIASAATSNDYQQKVADWIKNDPNPMVMNMNTSTPTTIIPTGANSSADSSSTSTSNSNQPALNNTQQSTTQATTQQPTTPQPAATQKTPQKPAASQAAPKPVSPSQSAVSTPNQSDLYNQMINNCVQWDQQMMQQYANPQNQAAMQQQWQNGVQQRQNVQKSSTNWNLNHDWNGNKMSGSWSGNMGW
ncbi:hypothetical protein SDC9_20791 [bioreactor metagenome]|uniref:Uncharacterized protein n=1 Tax=bioreactor metagenome TaxID=1076179 RepID=A0A644U835_9ZZZZ|nr:hypothetical protein [Desulfitobacterium hafniense]MEA5024568.1 hypothetical protein [Desulfitobacterium hafniense]